MIQFSPFFSENIQKLSFEFHKLDNNVILNVEDLKDIQSFRISVFTIIQGFWEKYGLNIEF